MCSTMRRLRRRMRWVKPRTWQQRAAAAWHESEWPILIVLTLAAYLALC